MPYKSGVDRTRIVVPPGPPGAPDCARVIYYGTVLRVGDELWMWYLAQGDDDRWLQRVCLATSRDGYQWHKPELGLVEYHGSKANNLVDLLGGEHNITVLVVVHEPDDPDPARRSKAVFQTKRYTPQFAVAFSADGVRWHEPERRPDLPGCEMAGVTIESQALGLGAGAGIREHRRRDPVLVRALGRRASATASAWQPGNATGWGFLQAFEPVNGRAPDNRHLISAPIDLQGKPAQVALNVDGLSEHAQVAVTIMDQFFRPLTGYAAEDCLRLASGLHRTVAWRSRELVEHADNTIRIRLDFTGIRPEDPKLYEIYIEMK